MTNDNTVLCGSSRYIIPKNDEQVYKTTIQRLINGPNQNLLQRHKKNAEYKASFLPSFMGLMTIMATYYLLNSLINPSTSDNATTPSNFFTTMLCAYFAYKLSERLTNQENKIYSLLIAQERNYEAYDKTLKFVLTNDPMTQSLLAQAILSLDLNKQTSCTFLRLFETLSINQDFFEKWTLQTNEHLSPKQISQQLMYLLHERLEVIAPYLESQAHKNLAEGVDTTKALHHIYQSRNTLKELLYKEPLTTPKQYSQPTLSDRIWQFGSLIKNDGPTSDQLPTASTPGLD